MSVFFVIKGKPSKQEIFALVFEINNNEAK